MTRLERQELFEDMRAYGIKRYRDGGEEVEMHPAPAPRTLPTPDEGPGGMPTRDELNRLKNEIDKPTKVGPGGQ